MRAILFFFSFFLVLQLLITESAIAQVENPLKEPKGQLPYKKDTTIVNPPSDTLLHKNDTTRVKADSVKAPKKGDIETTIFYSAEDSINSNLEGKIVRLYGNAKVKYGTIELEAEEIIIDYNTSIITANGRPDSTGEVVGFPIFKDGGTEYETRNMTYDFKKKKAKISEVVTKQGDGFLHADVAFKNEKNEIFSIGNGYTTCDLADPHFRIISKKTKAIPGDKMISGPFYMEFNHVPTPLGFAFGIFPSQKKSASGIIVPTYGEESVRGFFLRNGGYYFAISDYLNLTLQGDIYSKGASAIRVNSVYNSRYKYSGSFSFAYTNNKLTNNIEDKSRQKDFRITWSHSPKTKGTGRFAASVNAATSSYSTNNFLGVGSTSLSPTIDNTTTNLSSNVSYSKTFPGTPFNMGVNFRLTENLITKQVDLPFPDLSFNVNNIYPFKKVKSSMLLQNVNIKYTMNAIDQITNNLGRIGKNAATKDSIASFNIQNLDYLIRNAKKGVRNTIPLSTSFKVMRFFTVSPSINYTELWYFNKLDYGYKDAKQTAVVIKDTINGFNRVSNYTFGAGITTRIYGTYLAKNKTSRIRAIRHLVTPTISYSYNPDFSASQYNYYQKFAVKDTTTGITNIISKSRHDGFIYGSSTASKSNTMGFGIGNSIEMKVRSAKDTVDKKVSLINNMSINSSYNFALDSFKLAPVSMSANSNILDNKLNVNVNATLDPYQYVYIRTLQHDTRNNPILREYRSSHYAWNAGKIGRITSASLAFGTNLNPKGQKKDNATRDKISKSNASDADKKFLLQNPDAYVDFSIPWNLRLNYNASYSRAANSKATITQSVRFSGDISLSAKWKVIYNSGYDFSNKQFTQTYFSLNRELHCWQMSVGWTPFGRYQSFNFTIGVKSTLLRDLKINRTKSFIDSL